MMLNLRIALFAGLVSLYSALAIAQSLPPPSPPNAGQAPSAYISIDNVTRKSQGAWYRISLQQPLALSQIRLIVDRVPVKIYSVSVVDVGQNRIEVPELSIPNAKLERQILASRRLPAQRIMVIDLLAEAYGDGAKIGAEVESYEGFPQLGLRRGDEEASRPRSDLGGTCEEADHEQFMAAKNFAYSTEGLNYPSQAAVRWAEKYNESHACDTITEYVARFRPLRAVAYSTDGLNYGSLEAVNFALQFVEHTSAAEAAVIADTIRAVRGWAYGTEGMNLSSTEAAHFASSWVINRCESSNEVQSIITRHRKERDFAYSTAGLNLSFAEALRYANRKVAPLTRCGHLLPH